jgi:hypothetical protein
MQACPTDAAVDEATTEATTDYWAQYSRTTDSSRSNWSGF